MKQLVIVFIISGILFAACNNKPKDLSSVLKNYKESITYTNQVDHGKLIFYTDKYLNNCGGHITSDSIILQYKNTFLIIHKIQKNGVLKLGDAQTVNEIKDLYSSYGDSLMTCSLNRHIDKNTALIQFEEINDLSLSELKLISQTNLMLLENKIRDDIAGSIAIDCP